MAIYSKTVALFPTREVDGYSLAEVNAASMLEADHARIAILFGEFERAAIRGDVALKDGIAAQIFLELRLHMQIAEEIFFPAACEALGDPDAAEQALARNATVKQLIEKLESSSIQDAHYDARMMALGEYAVLDIEREESAFFPMVREAGLDLDGTGAALAFRRSELKSVIKLH